MVSANEKKRRDREKKKAQEKRRKTRQAEQRAEAADREKVQARREVLGGNEAQEPEGDEEYVIPELPFNQDDSRFDEYKKVFHTFSIAGDEDEKEDGDEGKKPKPGEKKSKLQLRKQVQEGEDGDRESGVADVYERSKKKKKKKFLVHELKQVVERPDVVTEVDTTSPDPKLLVFLKAYRNTVQVPPHWSAKRKFLSMKKGQEKPRYRLPEFIEATGIQKIREAVLAKEEGQGSTGRAKARLTAKMGKLDIDYQVLHDAFFKYQTRPKLTGHNDIYFEGKEQQMKMQSQKPGGKLTAPLMQALGMIDENQPPPWLFNMQRYGPPKAYPMMRIPGVNAPIPEGAEYGMNPGQWGRPPLDEFGNPKFGDWAKEHAARARRAQVDDNTLWGEAEDVSDDEEQMQAEGPEEQAGMSGTATPMVGHATPMIGVATPLAGAGTPLIGSGYRSTSGISSVTSNLTGGLQTPTMSMQYGYGSAQTGGVRSGSMTPGPQLFQVLEEQKRVAGAGGVFPSAHGYRAGGIATPGIATPGIATPGIATPGIATPGFATPGIATPGIMRGPQSGIASVGRIPGIQTPLGIQTPMGLGIATPAGGIQTPVGGIATPTGIQSAGGIRSVEQEGMMTADMIRAQLKQQEQKAADARTAAHQKDVKKKDGKKKKNAFKF
ncbi:unnamed protein product [Amoebophrya sp. A120]|nr:unnamed protein product [Amoebophrya sp. A120]|eukprot:GSA120T00002421001.1